MAYYSHDALIPYFIHLEVFLGDHSIVAYPTAFYSCIILRVWMYYCLYFIIEV